jgi:creatinine amidohydrolase
MYNSTFDGTRKKIHWQEFWRHELEAMLPQNPVVIVPVGSVEQHGPHCPMDVDIATPFHLAMTVAEAIDDFPVIVAPPVWSGFTHYNMGHIGTINLRLETFLALVGDVCRSLKANGFERMILLNGHGGNVAPLRTLSVQLAEEDVWALAFPYWDLIKEELLAWSEADEGSIGHGGEWETSLQLYLRPQLIAQERMVRNEWPRPDSFSPEFASFAFWPERRREAPLGVMGDPLVANAEKGHRAFEAAVARLIRLVREYQQQPLRRYHQFGSHCP